MEWDGRRHAAIGRISAPRGIFSYSTGVRGQHGDLSAARQHTKGHIDDGRLWERDFSEFVEWVQRRHRGIPLFLYGQSMGSLVAMLVLSERSGQIRPAGIILHSPAVAMIYASPIVRLGVGQLRTFKPRGLLFKVGLISGEKPALTNDPKFDLYWGSRGTGFDRDFRGHSLTKLSSWGPGRTAAGSMEVPESC